MANIISEMISADKGSGSKGMYYFITPSAIIAHYGLQLGGFLCYLMGAQETLRQKNKNIPLTGFFKTYEAMNKELRISRATIIKYINKLKVDNLVDINIGNKQNANYYFINMEEIINMFCDEKTAVVLKSNPDIIAGFPPIFKRKQETDHGKDPVMKTDGIISLYPEHVEDEDDTIITKKEDIYNEKTDIVDFLANKTGSPNILTESQSKNRLTSPNIFTDSPQKSDFVSSNMNQRVSSNMNQRQFNNELTYYKDTYIKNQNTIKIHNTTSSLRSEDSAINIKRNIKENFSENDINLNYKHVKKIIRAPININSSQVINSSNDKIITSQENINTQENINKHIKPEKVKKEKVILKDITKSLELFKEHLKPEHISNKDYIEALSNWIEVRLSSPKFTRSPLTAFSIKIQSKWLGERSAAEGLAQITNAIVGSWQAIRQPDSRSFQYGQYGNNSSYNKPAPQPFNISELTDNERQGIDTIKKFMERISDIGFEDRDIPIAVKKIREIAAVHTYTFKGTYSYSIGSELGLLSKYLECVENEYPNWHNIHINSIGVYSNSWRVFIAYVSDNLHVKLEMPPEMWDNTKR
jgi:biotin operon repressor